MIKIIIEALVTSRLCFMWSQVKRKEKSVSQHFEVVLFFPEPPAARVCLRIIGSVLSDDCRVLSILLVQQTDLLWLSLTATVAKHPTRPTTTDVLTVFNGARPIHCGFKVPLCVVGERPQTAVLKSPARYISSDITS